MSHREADPCQAASLADRGVLRIAGADASHFLQGLLTNDIGKAEAGTAIHAGLLSPQGKILFDFFVMREGDGYLIDAPKESLAPLAQRLTFYKLRANVTVEELPDFSVAAMWGGTPMHPDGAVVFADPRLPALGHRALLPGGASPGALDCAEAGEAAYHAYRIGLGVPEGGRDYLYGDAFPHEALFDQLNGVDFKKGCFVGQEVVSRMEHRGTARKRVVPVEGDAPLAAGAEVMAGDLPLGTIGSVDGTHGLALLRLDRAADAAAKGVGLNADGTHVRLRHPPFATFEVPSEPAA